MVRTMSEHTSSRLLGHRALRIFSSVLALTFSLSLAVIHAPDASASSDPSVTDFSQCANDPPPSTSTACPGGWINGILQGTNSHYVEDQVTPQRAVLVFPAGSPVVGNTI